MGTARTLPKFLFRFMYCFCVILPPGINLIAVKKYISYYITTKSFCKYEFKQMYSGLRSKFFLLFLGAFAGLRRATISFVMSICLSVGIE